jgi:hypothetical protein
MTLYGAQAIEIARTGSVACPKDAVKSLIPGVIGDSFCRTEIVEVFSGANLRQNKNIS